LKQNSCDEAHKPRQIRKIPPTRRSVSGMYAFRNESHIAFESTLERDFLIRTEFSLGVLDVISQPVQIPFIAANNQTYIYTPDFLVYFRLGSREYCDYPKPILVEVKPEQEWRKHWQEWLPKWRAAWRYAQEQGWQFRIRDESRIRNQALENIRFLARYKQMQFPPEDSRWILDTVRRMGCATVDYLLARHFMGMYRAEGISHIWHLLVTRQLDCHIDRPLGEFTELWVPSNE
jgi:TnsA endonuclease N terminal/TnsA endonuclease C terminal